MTNHVATHLRQLAPDEVARIVQKLRDGLPRVEVARAHGIGPERLAQIAVEHGLPAIVRPTRLVSRTVTEHRAREARTCATCGQPIAVGTRYLRRRRASVHVDCLDRSGGTR